MASLPTPSPPQAPPTFVATPESLLEDAEALIAATEHTWNAVVSKVQPTGATFDNTMYPIIQDENDRSTKLRILRFYASTSPSKQLRDASSKATTLFNDAEVELYGRVDMFRLVNAVLCNAADGHEGLDSESRYYLEKLHRKFKHNGCGIADPAARERFGVAQKRLRDVERQCNRNLHEEKAGLWLTLEELEGVPQSLISRLKEGTDGDNEGMLWVATKVSQSGPVMANAKREATRRKVYYAVQNRMPTNIALFRELVLLRDETARLIGYPNHAALRTADKMVRTPEFVTKLLAEIGEQLIPCGSEEMGILRGLKAAEGQKVADLGSKLFLWDQTYYARIQSEAELPPNDRLSGYFELQATLGKLLSMFEHIFGTHFKRITREQQEELGRGQPLTWHEHVQMYSVWNTDEANPRFLGYAYLDLYPREGKYTHAGHYSLQQGFSKPDSTRFFSSSAVVMNYNEPLATGEPTLLSLNDIRKLFHEIGHLIHALCTETKYASSAFVDRDFVEAPSLMFEQFFWKEQHIRDVSCHYSHLSPALRDVWRAGLPGNQRESAEQPPAQLDSDAARALAKMNHSKNVRDQLKELFFASFDMAVHTPASRDELEKTNLTELFNKMRVQIMNLHGGEAVGDGWEWGHGETVFRNIINGYDAGYYSYILGRVFALDIFNTGFAADTLSKDVRWRYRDMVLRPGGSQPEMEVLTRYLGRAPSTRPYFEYLGIEPRDRKSTV